MYNWSNICVFKLTRYDQEMDDNMQRYTMSWWADCSTLSSPYDGPVRLVMEPGRRAEIDWLSLTNHS